MGSPILELAYAQPVYLYSSGSVWGPIYFSINPTGKPRFIQTHEEQVLFEKFVQYLCGLRTDFNMVEYRGLPQDAVYAGYAIATEINSVSQAPRMRGVVLERFILNMKTGEWTRDMMSVLLSVIEELGMPQAAGMKQRQQSAIAAASQARQQSAVMAETGTRTKQAALSAIPSRANANATDVLQMQPISVRELVAEYFAANPSDFVPIVAQLIGTRETSVKAIAPLVLNRVSAEGADSFAKRIHEEIKKKKKEKYESLLAMLFGKKRVFRPDLGRMLSLVVKKTVTKK